MTTPMPKKKAKSTMQQMTLHGKLLERRYGSISDESKEELRNEEKIDCINRGRGIVNIQWSSPGILSSGCRKYL